MAAPSWAEEPPNGFGGNKASSHACYHEGYKKLFPAGSTTPFANQDACVSYYADKRV
jgi:hypothetical protein